jgi:sec-independent protein translocase protein TatB
MFDIGWGELLVIGIVALVAIGPKELPTVMRTIGHWMGKVRRMASEFQGQFQEALREAELEDFKKQADELKSTVTEVTKFDPLADIDNDGEAGFEPAKSESTTEPEISAHEEPAEATVPAAEPSAVQPPEPLPAIDVPRPETSEPITEKDFVQVDEPPPKQAGGKA